MSQVAVREETAVVETDQPKEVLGSLLRMAQGDPERAEKYLALYERMQALQAEREFNGSLADLQKDLRPVAFNAMNPETKSEYATYLQLDKYVRPKLIENGFAISYDTEEAGQEEVRVIAWLRHQGGHKVRFQVTMPADGKGPKGGSVMSKTHAMGAAITYGKRYLLCMIANIAVGPDDDGNSATMGDAELDELYGLIKLTDTDAKEVCIHYEVEHISELNKKQYKECLIRLRRKAKASGKLKDETPEFLR